MATIAGSRSQILSAYGSLRGLEEVLELACEELRRVAISARKTDAEAIQKQRGLIDGLAISESLQEESEE